MTLPSIRLRTISPVRYPLLMEGAPAAIMSDTGEALTRAALDDRSRRLANLFEGAGLVPGDRVAILMENNLAWFVAMWGARRAGLLYVPVNWHLKPAEIAYVVENSDARAMLTTARLADLAAEAIAGLDVPVRLATGDPGAPFDDLDRALDAAPAGRPARETDGGPMPYSSGTTGRPKGILRPPTGEAFGALVGTEASLAEMYGFDADSVYLSPAPLYHASPLSFCASVLLQGGTVVHMPSFDAEAALAAIERHRVTHVQFVPTHFVRMLRLSAEVRARYDLSSLRVVVHAAAPCPPDVKHAMIEWLGPIVHEYYAGSERCGLTAIDSHEWLARPGSVGRSRTSPIHILDLETGTELPAGEVGQVWFERPVPFVYHKDAEKTAATIDARGWGTHGDVGHLDDDGYLFLADRRSDLILSGGVNVYPREVEDALATHPAVADAAVIGVDDADMGKRVHAVVQLLPGASASEADIVAHARAHLAHFKAPRSVAFVDALPRLPNGKLLRRRLTEPMEESA